MSEFRMPSLGADMDAGTLVEWIKHPGDHVKRGEAIAAVETQKGAIEIEAFETGVLDDIRVKIGERVPVGTVLAMIRTEGEPHADSGKAAPAVAKPPVAPTPAAPPPVAPRVAAAPPAAAAPVAAAAPASPASGQRITPAARRRAGELGMDIASLRPDASGVIGLHEVESAAATATVTAGAARTGPAPAAQRSAKPGLDLGEMRKAIAAAMTRSWREIPHYFVSSAIDVEPMLAWLERENARRPVAERLHYAAPLIRATALALKAVPELNGHNGSAGFEPAESVHLGIAVAMRGGGLIAPAILDADTLDLAQTMARLNDLVARVRSGRLRSSEMTAATATFSNLGEGTADALQPIIYPPQVAIVGCGRIAPRPWADGTSVGVRRVLTVTVGGDHRVSDGRRAAAFLARFAELLQKPERL